MSGKSRKNLIEFFMENRPGVRDLYSIYDSVLVILMSTGHGEHILLNAESIFYDRKRNKIRFLKNNNIRNEPYTDALYLFEYIRNECKYAGDDISGFTDGLFNVYVRTYKTDDKLIMCRKYLDNYREKEGIGYTVLLAAGVVIAELVLRQLF